MASILIIDDEPEVLRVLKRILEHAGHTVSEAPNGEVALKRFVGQPADLVVTDIFMPGMDGIEFLMHVRTAFPQAKVVVMSGGGILPRDQVLGDATHLGADLVLEKPFTSHEVLATVERALSSS